MATAKEICPNCGLEIPDAAPGGLCPKCLLDSNDTPTVASKDGDEALSVPMGVTLPAEKSLTEAAPERIGHYRILEPIGEGGMGQVYVAERREPVKQRVAIKIIKPGMDSREVLARFDAERHALALMDHHNVSRVIDAGMMENGRPYFVMELVLGHPITEFCDRNHLAIEDRLELFYQVCQGVQHAHQKGIIHRDIKPSNVIVTVNNHEPIPKIIDFGIAKAMGAELTQQTYFTFAGQIIGTPHYMSPEQAESHPTDVDTRSDIYSLGVLLYELLTGRTPLTKEDFQEVGLEQMLQMIRVTEPVRPSTVVTKLDQEKVATVSENRRATVRRLSHTLKGDLDWMVMKALEKDRSRRYETANAFAMDVRRYLRGETITATPPTLRYQLGKFMKRHKGPLIASSLITCSLVAGLVVSLWQADRAQFEAARAKDAEEVAVKAAKQALADKEEARKQKEIAEGERENAQEQEQIAQKARKDAQDAAEAALAEKERAEKAEKKALAEKDNAEKAKKDALAEKEKAEKALADLQISEEEKERIKVLRQQQEERIGKLLSFLRSEEMRKEFQKKDLNGLDIVRSIDDMVLDTFPDVSRDSDLQVQDFRLSLKLGEAAKYSLESSLVTAENNFRSALGLWDKVNFNDPDEGLLERARILLSLAEIARGRGDYVGALENLRSVEVLGGSLSDQAQKRELELWLGLEKLTTNCDAGDESKSLEGLLQIGNHLASGKVESDREEEYRSRFLSIVAGLEGPELESLVSSLPAVSREKIRSRSGLVAVIQIDLNRELRKVREFAAARREFESKSTTMKGSLSALPGVKLKRTEAELQALEKRRADEEEILKNLLRLLQEIREMAVEVPDRRFRVLELEAEHAVAEAYRVLERTYLALQHFQRCLDRSDALLRLDSEMIAPLEAQALAGQAIAGVYGKSGEGGRRLAALETAYRALLEAEARGVSAEHFPADRNELVEDLIVATIYEFYAAMSSPSTLEENSFYADEVLYFGGKANGQMIMQNQLAYRSKYPHRLFVVKEISDVIVSENANYTVVVELDFWLANPEKDNDMDYDEPEGDIAQRICFAFDEGSRLKIVEIGAAPEEKVAKQGR